MFTKDIINLEEHIKYLRKYDAAKFLIDLGLQKMEEHEMDFASQCFEMSKSIIKEIKEEEEYYEI